MSDALETIKYGLPHGTVILADYQFNGIGRTMEKRWICPRRQGILMTVALLMEKLPKGRIPEALTLRIGGAVAEAIDAYTAGSQVKWPNDVFLRGKKVAGILCQVKQNVLLVGIGVNCNQKRFSPLIPDKHSYRPLCEIAISIRMVARSLINRMELVERILLSMNHWIHEDAWKQILEQRLLGVGKRVHIQETGAGGILKGIGERGELLISNDISGEAFGEASGETFSIVTGSLRFD